MKFCELKNKNIVVTGASSGLGRDICILLSKLNANVCLIGRDKIKLKKTVSLMKDANHQILSFDLYNFEKYKDQFKYIVNKMGHLHGLVHFAGIEKREPIQVIKIKSTKEIFEINFHSFIELCKQFSKISIFSDGGASIVTASSVASFRGIPSLTAYGASKSALNTAIKTLSIELASKKIRVNGIAPGYVDTEMNSSIKEKLPKGAYERILNEHPLGIGEPRDISNLVVFLLSDESKWISGTTIPIDGGFLAK